MAYSVCQKRQCNQAFPHRIGEWKAMLCEDTLKDFSCRLVPLREHFYSCFAKLPARCGLAERKVDNAADKLVEGCTPFVK